MNIIDKVYKFYNKFSGKKGIVCYSENGKIIPYFCIEKSQKPVIIATYAIHAREYITSYIALKDIVRFNRVGKRGTIYFVPILNPDGVEIALKENPLYKANYNMVDLNVNFDANWGKGEKNIGYKNSENYIGEFPFSESESKGLRDFTLKVKPDYTISYHSKGEEIYWYFNQNKVDKKRDFKIAKGLSKITGYNLKYTLNSVGGYKDWCIDKLKIPAFTIEVGNDKLSHPIGKKYLNRIYKKVKNVILFLTEL